METKYIVLMIYAIGAFVSHFLIHKDGEGEIEQETADVVCLFWPLAFIVGIIMGIIRWWKRNMEKFDDWMY